MNTQIQKFTVTLKIPHGNRTETIQALRASGVSVSDSGRNATATTPESQKALDQLIEKGWAEAPMWTGIVTRKYAEYIMMAASVAGGFIAVDMPVYDPEGYYAAIPNSMTPPSPADGWPMPMEKFRAALIRANSCTYLGSGEEHADRRGFATIARIQPLLDKLEE